MSPEEKFAADAAQVQADLAIAKGWFERNLNWIIAGGCFVAGAIAGHLA